MELKCDYLGKDWRQAKQEVKAVLIGRAKARDVISYFELAVRVPAIKFDPDSLTLRTLLQEIGAEENAAGRGMLSAVVVYSAGERQPDLEFLYLATQLGKNTSNIMWCWLNELKRVFNCWSQAKRKPKSHCQRSKQL
ncbi:MAG: hypothetical protein WC600_05880 [Desulfobaccales bacterium]